MRAPHINTVFAVMQALPNPADSLTDLFRAIELIRGTPHLQGPNMNSGEWLEPSIPPRFEARYWMGIAEMYRPRKYRDRK